MGAIEDAASKVEDEGMSTGKKVAAGAALGVAVPAAVGVAKKLLGNGGDDAGDEQRQTGGDGRSEQRTRPSGASRSSSRPSGSVRRAGPAPPRPAGAGRGRTA